MWRASPQYCQIVRYAGSLITLFTDLVKENCTLVQALRLCTGRTAHRRSRAIAVHFHDHGTRRLWGVSVTPRPLLATEKDPYPLYRRLGGPQDRSVWKISPLTGIRSSDRPARSQSLYRLHYPAHTLRVIIKYSESQNTFGILIYSAKYTL